MTSINEIGEVELPVAVQLQNSEKITDDPFTPADNFEWLSNPYHEIFIQQNVLQSLTKKLFEKCAY